MKNITSLALWTTIVTVAFITQGCASFSKIQDASSKSNSTNSDVEHIVQKGDLLGEIAKTYTGQIAQWQVIAQYNDIDNPHALSIGDVIRIPAHLIPDATVSVAEKTSDQERESLIAASASTSQSNVSGSATNSLAVKRDSRASQDPAPVVVRPVQVNREFDLKPIDVSSLKGSSVESIAPPRVRVSGTYFPKGVYKEPASYSSLIMRVAPGTVFELEREINDWYKVITDHGIGYLRVSDGRILSEQQQ